MFNAEKLYRNNRAVDFTWFSDFRKLFDTLFAKCQTYLLIEMYLHFTLTKNIFLDNISLTKNKYTSSLFY